MKNSSEIKSYPVVEVLNIVAIPNEAFIVPTPEEIVNLSLMFNVGACTIEA